MADDKGKEEEEEQAQKNPIEVFKAAARAAGEVIDESEHDMGFVTMAAIQDPEDPDRSQVRFISNMPEQMVAQMCGQTAEAIIRKLQAGNREDSDIITPPGM